MVHRLEHACMAVRVLQHHHRENENHHRDQCRPWDCQQPAYLQETTIAAWPTISDLSELNSATHIQ